MAVKITHVDIGDRMQPQWTFTVGGVATDPTNLTVRQQDADGVETTLLNNQLTSTLNSGTTPVAKTATGVYKLNPGVSATKQGYWFFRGEGTGAAEAAEEFQYNVDPSEFTSNAGLDTKALVSLVEMKEWLQYQNVTTENDLEIVTAINDVSDRIVQESGGREFKPFGTNPAVRLFDVEWTGKREPWYIDGEWQGDLSSKQRTVAIGDLAATPTLVRILDTNWTTSLETVTSGNRTDLPLVRQAWEPIRCLQFQPTVTTLTPGMRVEVTGTWGFPAVPGDIKQAVKDAVAAILDRDVEHYATDLAATIPGGAQSGNVIVMTGGRQRLLSLPGPALAAAWRYRDPVLT